jgi:anti-sigma factor RsiW
MNCNGFGQLLDAYLDEELKGGLRLEFDAHRLRCARCQQTLAMMEALAHTVASDNRAPALSPQFTDGVMARLSHRPRRLMATRVVVAVGMVAQAAAVLLLALYLGHGSPEAATSNVVVQAGVGRGAALTASLNEVDVYEDIVNRVEQRITRLHAAGRTVTGDVVQLAQYLNITLPEDLADASLEMAVADPWTGFWRAVFPVPAAENSETSVPIAEEYSL